MTPSYIHLAARSEPPTLSSKPFRAVLVTEQEVEEEWRDKIANWLVEGGCLYLVAWGVQCEAWHDSVDGANLRTFESGEIPDDRFVMTTWHEMEPLSEALWFAGQCANHPSGDLDRTILVHVAEQGSSKVMLEAFRQAQE